MWVFGIDDCHGGEAPRGREAGILRKDLGNDEDRENKKTIWPAGRRPAQISGSEVHIVRIPETIRNVKKTSGLIRGFLDFRSA